MGRPGALNAIAPYFTMFPLEFPISILRTVEVGVRTVLDPFCGRGTTNYACRLAGISSVGVDNSRVAVAIAEAKLANASPARIVASARRILGQIPEAQDVPSGEFWQ
ncbi:MAG TPA: DNA methyltransferase, partial [Dehalococcoidia bacterium]|nr:DNA methyltransferase [Dehalococcoidia bacterium]